MIKKIKPYKKNNINLKVRNKSSRPKIENLSAEELNAINKFVNYKYTADLKYYKEKYT